MYAVAGSMVVDEFDRALNRGPDDPSRQAVEAAICLAAVRMGFVPSAVAPTPLDWWPAHLEAHLREENSVEYRWKVMLRAGIRAEYTGAADGQGTPNDGSLWVMRRDAGGRVLWERPGVVWSEALCGLGLVRFVDVYGGTDEDGVGFWMAFEDMYRVYEDAAWQRGTAGLARLRREYDDLLRALEVDPSAVEWLTEYAKGWPKGHPPPQELEAAQRDIDRDMETPRRPPIRLDDVRESGRRTKAGAEVLEYLAVWPGRDDGEWGSTWETRLTLGGLGAAWTDRLRKQADALEQRDQTAMRRTWRGEWRMLQKVYDVGQMPAFPAVLPFNMRSVLVNAFGERGWGDLQAKVGDAARQGDVRKAWALAELFAIRSAVPEPLPSVEDLVGVRRLESERRWEPDVRQQLFGGELRDLGDDGVTEGSRRRWRNHAGELWEGTDGRRVPSLAVADDAEARRVTGLARGRRVDVERLRECVRGDGAGEVWSRSEECRALTEELGATSVAALFERWREAETPWAVGGIDGRRTLCRGLSVSQARMLREERGLVANKEHVGTDTQHAADIASYDSTGGAGGLSFSKEVLTCARYALGASGLVAFVRVSDLQRDKLHDYSTATGGERLRAAAADPVQAERAVRFAAADAEVRSHRFAAADANTPLFLLFFVVF